MGKERAKTCDQTIITKSERARIIVNTFGFSFGFIGRTPHGQNSDGRDHNNKGYSIWLAGGGVKAGSAHGKTDELGYEAVEDAMHVHDLHATILHLLGLDHERLTYRYAGRDMRLTDIKGIVHKGILA